MKESKHYFSGHLFYKKKQERKKEKKKILGIIIEE